MTREKVKEMLPILQAYAEGKVIECRTKPSALSKSWQGMNDWTEIKDERATDDGRWRARAARAATTGTAGRHGTIAICKSLF